VVLVEIHSASSSRDAEPARSLKSNSLDLVLRESVLRAVVKLGRARTFMRGHGLRMLQRAAIAEIGGDPRRAKRVIADRRHDVCRRGTPADHASGVGLRHRLLGQHGGAVSRAGAEQPALAVLGDAGGDVSVQRFGERMMARHLVLLAAFLVQPQPPARTLKDVIIRKIRKREVLAGLALRPIERGVLNVTEYASVRRTRRDRMPQITQFLRRAVQTNAHGLATIDGERRQDWQSFQGRVARLAGAIRWLGYEAGDRIGILSLNSDRYLESFFALSWAGVVFVPINTRLAIPEMEYWLTDSGCTGLLVDDAFLSALEALSPRLPELRHVIYLGMSPVPAGLHGYEALIEAAPPVPDAGRRGNDLAGIFYTGGTTGRSKGVMLSHTNILANAQNLEPGAEVSTSAAYIHAAPMFHLADGAMTFLVTAYGGTHAFMPRFDPGALLLAIEVQRITHLLIVPTMVNMLVHHRDAEKCDLSSVQKVLYGASPMPEAVVRRALKLLPRARFTQAYGQSEASPVMTLLPHTYHTFEGPDAGRIKSAGRAVIGCELRIHDQDDNEVPPGTMGEICGRGPLVMMGYWNQPDLTANTLRNSWLHTGDGGYMDDDGFVYVVDRLKDMIVSGGENVYSAEVEEVLYSHPAVAECAVIGVPDDTWGERVHAVVRLKQDMQATAEELIAGCHKLIANYKCPRTVEIRDNPLPLSGAGKILKAELRRLFWEGHERRVN
jgi:long-chain acyl-CoA synthetase